MISQKLTELNNYLDFLREQHNLSITVHSKSDFISKNINILKDHCIHSNPYCMCIKSKKELWGKCAMYQNKIFKRASSDLFYGMCYAGVEEYVFPVFIKDKTVALICVSGYRSNGIRSKNIIRTLSARYSLEEKEILESYFENLSENPPSENFIRSTITVAVRLLEQIAEESIIQMWESVSTEDYVYSHIIAYIKQNFNRKISVKELSDFCHCSVSYINHIFKRKNGEILNNYINSIRTEKAKLLLRNTKMSIKEVAFATGLTDSNYFSTVFKRHCGVSPREYKKLL